MQGSAVRRRDVSLRLAQGRTRRNTLANVRNGIPGSAPRPMEARHIVLAGGGLSRLLPPAFPLFRRRRRCRRGGRLRDWSLWLRASGSGRCSNRAFRHASRSTSRWLGTF
jgi:hypothetical protein